MVLSVGAISVPMSRRLHYAIALPVRARVSLDSHHKCPGFSSRFFRKSARSLVSISNATSSFSLSRHRFSVAVSNMSSPDLNLTDSCVKRLEQIRIEKKLENLFLRLTVKSGGCEGFSYAFSFEDTPPESDDLVVRSGKAQVVVDSASFDLIKGSTVDYLQEMIRSAFVIVKNPNSESSCGCGSSFSIK
uniref:Core domain-containing protein n=1 Tax=Spongospora subterranea TaxID=70186 RepID=A0A0H5R7T4_9EUKA|eukprot:CRZ10240.1 hypothetical protein [Spongospora subterranea]